MTASAASAAEHLNRPILQEDLAALDRDPSVAALRDLVAEYRAEALPVLNGSFAYSNLLEGPRQVLTCNPYRLWEYGSLVQRLGEDRIRFLDVGGASSPLGYLLAERGHSGLAVDLQPMLVDLCNYVAQVRGLDLKAEVADVTRDLQDRAAEFDLVIFVSVLEHIPQAARRELFEALRRLLKPGGRLYMTFDYGSYVERETQYLRHRRDQPFTSESIADLASLCEMVTGAGFTFIGNDPRTLPENLRNAGPSPEWRRVAWIYAMNGGVFDADTPWSEVAKYLLKRVLRHTGARTSRFAQHTFFRMFLQAS